MPSLRLKVDVSIKLELADALARNAEDLGGHGVVQTPMHGKAMAVFVEPGAVGVGGEPLFIVEAMKMEYSASTPRDGIVARLAAAVGDQIANGAAVVALEDLVRSSNRLDLVISALRRSNA